MQSSLAGCQTSMTSVLYLDGVVVRWNGTQWISRDPELGLLLDRFTEQVLDENPDRPLPPLDEVARLVLKRISAVLA